MRLSELSFLGAARTSAGTNAGDGAPTGGSKGGKTTTSVVSSPGKKPGTGATTQRVVTPAERAAAEAKRRAAQERAAAARAAKEARDAAAREAAAKEADAKGARRRDTVGDSKKDRDNGGGKLPASTPPSDPNMGADGKCRPSYVLVNGKCTYVADGIPPEPPKPKQDDTPPVVSPDGVNTTKEVPNQPVPIKAETVPGTSSGGGGGGPGPEALPQLVEQDPVVGVGPVVSPIAKQSQNTPAADSTASPLVKYGLWVLGAGAIGFAIYKFRRKA